MLTVLLTGAAFIREREQGTIEHLLVMPVVPIEIMMSKMLANGIVILAGAELSMIVVVQMVAASAGRRIVLLFLVGAAFMSCGRVARNFSRHADLHHGPVWFASGSGPTCPNAAFGCDYADGKHAGVAAVSYEDNQSDAAFCCVCGGCALSGCGFLDRLAGAVEP